MVKKSARDETTGCDVGTMWTMRRHGRVARCALLALPREWELRVLLEGEPLLTRRCVQARSAFETAEEWRQRMTRQGWSTVRPQYPLNVA